METAVDARISEKENLSQLLRKWAVEEMRFHASSYNNGKQIPTENDFEKLCRTPFTNIWGFLLRRTKTSQHARQVKDNLAIQRRERQTPHDVREKNESLRRRKQELEAEMSRLVDDIAMIERETNQMSELLEDATQGYENGVEHVRNLQRKKCVLSSAFQCANEKETELGEYSSRLNRLTDSVRIKRKESERNNYLPVGDGDSRTEMETESCTDVRLVCQDISTYLHSSLGNAQKGRADNKGHVLDKVSDLHECYSIHTLLDSLTKHTVSCSRLLRAETVRVNIPSEVQDLSFSMDKRGHVHDESAPHSMQTGLKKLLQTSHLNHVMRWSEEQKYLCESWKLEAQLDDVRGEIHKMIVKTMGGNPGLAQQAESYVDQLLHLASEKSVAPCLKQEMQILTNKIIKGKVVHEELQAKFSQIQEFKKVVENKQAILGTLAKYNSGAPTRMDKLKEQCKTYLASRPIHSHLDFVETMTSDLLLGCLEKEINKFHLLPLVCFQSLTLNSGARSSVLDVSISPSIIPGTRGTTQAFSLLCEALHHPAFKSPDHLMSHVLHLQKCIQESHLTQERMEADRAAMCRKSGVQDDPQYHRDLTRRSREHDVHLQETSLPRIARLSDMSRRWTHKVADDMPIHLVSWWQQPAQHSTPWAAVEGFTFDQWMQRFKVIISQVHQKHLDKQHSQ